MPENHEEEDTTITYADLSDFEQGYANAAVGHFSNRDDAARWIGIDGESLATETLAAIRRDCRRFVVRMIESGLDENGSMELIDELYDYDAGRLFLLERMEVGIGFSDMASVEVHVRQRLVNAAVDFKPFELDIGEDRLVQIVIGPALLAPVPAWADWAVAQSGHGQPYVQRYRSIEMASATVLAACRGHSDNCKVILTGKDGCVASATTGKVWGVARAGSATRANASALKICSGLGAAACEIELSFCGR